MERKIFLNISQAFAAIQWLFIIKTFSGFKINYGIIVATESNNNNYYCYYYNHHLFLLSLLLLILLLLLTQYCLIDLHKFTLFTAVFNISHRCCLWHRFTCTLRTINNYLKCLSENIFVVRHVMECFEIILPLSPTSFIESSLSWL